ncbi:MAG: hypothetical protein EPN30_03840 [Actinomycetota bacterium]|nr:MAG: hypothetical protein EPN30_03840 [Actinomycetota bacterium]
MRNEEGLVVTASLILLAAIVVAAALSLHLGPHGLVASGVIGAVSSMILIVDIVFLADTAPPELSLGLLSVAAALSFAIFVLGIRTIKSSRILASATLMGKLAYARGVAITDLTPMGTVRILGEIWSAESLSGPVKAGVEVYVSEIDGLRLKVWANPELSQNIEQEKRA